MLEVLERGRGARALEEYRLVTQHCNAAPKPGQVQMQGQVPLERRTEVRNRRQFTPEFKAKVVLDVLTGVQSQAEACRKHGLGPNLLALWKTALIEKAHLIFDSELRGLGGTDADRRIGTGPGAHDPGERDPNSTAEERVGRTRLRCYVEGS